MDGKGGRYSANENDSHQRGSRPQSPYPVLARRSPFICSGLQLLFYYRIIILQEF